VQNYFNQKIFAEDISRFSASLFLATALAVLAGCGAGQAIPTVPAPAVAVPGAAPPAATIQLLLSNTLIPSAGTTTVDLTAIVLSATREAISGKTVTFSTGSSATETAFINNISASGVSDASGKVTATLNLGKDKTNRQIPISATITADSVTTSSSVDVTGTAITIAGNTALALGNTTTLTFTIKDSGGTPIPSIALTVSSSAGNTITFKPGVGITCTSASICNSDNAGQLIADVKAIQGAASDTITVTGGGASKTQNLAINNASFNFTAPTLAAGATSIDIPLFNALVPSSSPTVSVKWSLNNAPVAGTQVTFSSTRGTLVPANGTVLTDVNGVASVTISSTLAGPAIITASGVAVAGAATPPAATLTVAFVAQSAANVTVQAVPGTVAVTTGSTNQTNNISTVSAVVRDTAGNLVKNAGISFALTDLTGGTLSSGTARTDISGSASVTYTAGAISSAANGVTIRATVTDITSVGAIPPVSSGVASYPDAKLTVANQPLLIRLGTDNQVATSGTNNQKTYSAVVSDASQNAIAGTSVRFALRPARYAKGFFTFVLGHWVQTFTTLDPYVVGNTECANEDLNFNGILDTGEDINGSKALEPGGTATVTPSATSDANGIAVAVITYPKNYSWWSEVILEARAGVVGNDPPTTTKFFLPGLASEYKDAAIEPPGRLSPYGISNSCANTQ
jgi:hypothetical protein